MQRALILLNLYGRQAVQLTNRQKILRMHFYPVLDLTLQFSLTKLFSSFFFSWKKESIFTGRQRRSKWSLSTLCFGLLCARISSKVRVWQKPVWVHVARPKGHAQIYGHRSTFAQTFGLFKKILWPGQIYSPSQQLRHFWRIFCGQTVWVQSGPKKSQNLYGQTSICLKN